MSEVQGRQQINHEAGFVSGAQFKELENRFLNLESQFTELQARLERVERRNSHLEFQNATLMSAVANAIESNFDHNSQSNLMSVFSAANSPSEVVRRREPTISNPEPEVVLRSRSGQPNTPYQHQQNTGQHEQQVEYVPVPARPDVIKKRSVVVDPNMPPKASEAVERRESARRDVDQAYREAKPFSAAPRGTAKREHFTDEEAARAREIMEQRRNSADMAQNPDSNPEKPAVEAKEPIAQTRVRRSRNIDSDDNRKTVRVSADGCGGGRGGRSGGGGGGRFGGNGENHENGRPNGRTKRLFRRFLGAAALGAALLASSWALFSGSLIKKNKSDTTSNALPNTPAMAVNVADKHKVNQPEELSSSELSKYVSIGEASRSINSNRSNIRENIAAIFNSNEHIKLDHSNGAMSNVLNEYAPGEIDAVNGAEVVALSAKSSDSYAAGLYNAMKGRHVQEPLPSGVSPDEARDYIEKVMTNPGTRFSIQHPTGAFENHGMRGENRFSDGIVHANGDISMFVMTDVHGNKTYIKTSNECFNILNKLVGGRHVKTRYGTLHVPAPTPSNPNPKPQFYPRPKHDYNHTPAGVPGEPRGSGGNGQEHSRPHAGDAPASVGQPQTQKPERIPTTGGSSQPAETGVDHGTTGPATPGAGTDKPAQHISSGTTPSGD